MFHFISPRASWHIAFRPSDMLCHVDNVYYVVHSCAIYIDWHDALTNEGYMASSLSVVFHVEHVNVFMSYHHFVYAQVSMHDSREWQLKLT